MSHNRAPMSPACMDCGCPYSLFRDYPTCNEWSKEPRND